jgi:hypothetical protein
MRYLLEQHRHGLTVAKDGNYNADFEEFLSVITDITDQDIIDEFTQTFSLSKISNKLLES